MTSAATAQRPAPALPEIVTVSSGPLSLGIVPDIGGSIARFTGLYEHGIVDWLRPASDDALARRDPLGMGSFPLIPFCNRIRDGRFTFAGTAVHLPANYGYSRHAIHGDAWQRPWTVAERSAEAVTIACEHRPDAWPFHYAARQTYALEDGGLTVRLCVENRGPKPMPLGLGHHPYFPRTAGTTVTAEVDAIWSTDAEVMPTVLERTWVTERLAAGLRVDDADLDNNFTGWNGTAVIRWPERRAVLRMTAPDPLRFLVAYTPAGADFFCLEPVGNCTDWVNLTGQGTERVGGMVVAAGASAEVSFRLEPSIEG